MANQAARPAEPFYWGAATSSHQVEGGNKNDWTEWEHANSARLATEAARRHAKAPTRIPDYIIGRYPNPLQVENYISGRACDHYKRFREDFDLAKKLGHNAHRFSLEWSRIEPEEGKFNEKEIEHYREVIRALRERGIEPFVTLWHWTLPTWVRDQGGWENQKTIADFERYARKASSAFGDAVRFWIPINEPTAYAGHAYLVGAFPPQVKSYRRSNRVLRHLIMAHRRAYALIHAARGDAARVGSAHNLHWHVPYRGWSPLDRLGTALLNYIRDIRPLGLIRDAEDFIGVNYYFRDHVAVVPWGGRFGMLDIKNPDRDVSDLGWDIAPEGIYHALKRIASGAKPIYITENGIADARDHKRAAFIRDHILWIKKAIAEGVPVRGYFHWSLLDNFEWDKGFWPRFGLVEVDYRTLERTPRPSALRYRALIEQEIDSLRI